jgi:hypothetical protein
VLLALLDTIHKGMGGGCEAGLLDIVLACSLQSGQTRVARRAESFSVVPPLPLSIGSVKEKQAYERELHTVTVGEHSVNP